ncbi:MAG: bifunctional DNA-formamidopyrimidine glycosylase/DNA-(apurinic or apyrimidinic site) lyase [Rhodospirillaceae bacterium]|jgi:formamidopyrimidine-DNA glycosylase|nr:bifunctional DNA-formamidopyrimidine glycosylase/DNA-(apurinic or apyrimidinic site) lyase [Rhodospirillaceae bacterium]MBT3809908.1 bifunctional DNA-formamidopyrimidine glycosylase/DNA-(apurinic or apyrimidinic site) lyase [Rhodospirillaceae bacterium]MBT4772831.1 bifunctional DNA-formamidopyrimidine glycosylase/DNA-(apurinic or apyrimidinic site) lyase [Rhodospirillaceae bacterium]MBT5360080.1 bifunctional DNA-formamidopyrimidine glycosylase/DNA-(apurinic or apyrimidinic site) lyase [Rhodos
MPELPEVETVVRGLRPALEGKRLTRVELRRPDLRFPFPEGFAERLRGRTVTEVVRRAKYILIRLDSGETWLAHLGMSGRFTVTPGRSEGATASAGQAGHNSGWALAEKHDHVLVEAEDGGRIIYNDTRRFGFMDLIAPGGEADSPHLRALGPEPLSADFTPEYLAGALRGKRTPIKAALLDQRVVAGIGNIYACEALWRAGISPRRSAHTIAGGRAERLVGAVCDVLTEAIEAGGSSLRDYVQTDGELGYFQHRWAVYDQAGETCAKCVEAGIEDCRISRIVQSGRSTFYCSRQQR